VLSSYGVPFPQMKLTNSPEEAQAVARKMSGPVVMKVVSRDILHKSNIGGVISGITEDTAAASYIRILNQVQKSCPQCKIEGVLVQKQELEGIEVIIGAVRDCQFGHVVMFGLGGIFTEVMNDAVFRVVPLTMDDAREMIISIRGHAILHGLREQPPVDIEAIGHIILSVSRVVEDYRQISELDLNPVIVRQSGAVAVDAAIRTEEANRYPQQQIYQDVNGR